MLETNVYSSSEIFMLGVYRTTVLFQEHNDFEESKLYKQYVAKRDRCDGDLGGGRGRSLNRLALNALNAVNAISQDDQTSRVAFV